MGGRGREGIGMRKSEGGGVFFIDMSIEPHWFEFHDHEERRMRKKDKGRMEKKRKKKTEKEKQ